MKYVMTVIAVMMLQGCSTIAELHQISMEYKRAAYSYHPANYSNNNYGTPVYNQSQCIGASVNGECHGSVMGQPVATCHGTMLNGQCTGPMF